MLICKSLFKISLLLKPNNPKIIYLPYMNKVQVSNFAVTPYYTAGVLPVALPREIFFSFIKENLTLLLFAKFIMCNLSDCAG